MKLKNTVLLFVLAAGLFAFINLYESKRPGSREARDQAGRVVDLDRDDVEVVTIKNSETKMELKREGDGWRLTEPVKDRADTMVMSQLFTSLETLRADETIAPGAKGGDKDQLKEFGLFNSETKLKLSGKKKTVELIFGKDTAVEGKVYVKREDSNTAYVIAKDLKEQISRKVDEFRDHKLTDLNTTQVERVSIKTTAGEIELERKERHWIIAKPLKARGDDSQIGDLISRAATAKIESFIGDASNAGHHGLQEPRATISLWTDAREPTVLQLGANPKEDKDKDKVYAKVSSRSSVVLLSKSLETFLTLTPNDLRDKNLLRIEPDIVDRINIEGQGAEKIVLARKGESWVRKAGTKDEPIEVPAANRLLATLQTQQVKGFVADVATELPKYGLDQPRVRLTLSSYASENTAETKAGEKPIVAVLFGKVEDDAVYARLEDEPFIVSVPASILESLMTDPLQWQPLDIFNYKGEEITALEVSRTGQGMVAAERDAEKKWKVAKGDGTMDQINTESLANTLGSLRAVRWVGPPQPGEDFSMPTLAVSFKTASGSARLSVLAEHPEATPRAMVEGRPGVFEISRPDFSALQLSLVAKPSPPAATPAPAGAPAPATVAPGEAPPAAPPAPAAPPK